MHVGYYASCQEEQYLSARDKVMRNDVSLERYRNFIRSLLKSRDVSISSERIIDSLENSAISIDDIVRSID